MPLQVGARLGPYEVLALIGAGGMGEVYRAKDAKLGRDVAIKVLPDAVAGDPDRLARFHREAQVLAALNHPNIAHIHGYEDSSNIHALVMELVEGPTLADRIAQGPIPIAEALPVARQIAEALEAAHEQGIIHRDLKPANIKVREDGTVKVLDFGLARLVDNDAGRAGTAGHGALTASPTITTPAMTMAGAILGTAAYMAPEQARGRTVDKRADIWAFGCVLYEMLTARRAFVGEEVSDALAAIILKDVDWSLLPATTPDAIRRLLKRCLEKHATNRLHAIADARLEIDEALATPPSDTTRGSAATPLTRTGGFRSVLPWLLAAVTMAGLVTVLALTRPWRSESVGDPMRLSVELGADVSLLTDTGAAAVLSPDGRTLVFSAQKAPNTPAQLYVRRLDQLSATLLQGTDDGRDPFLSPDGKWVAFFAGGKLKKVALTGAAVVTLCDAPNGRGGTWAEDGSIVFSPNTGVGVSLLRVSSAGGKPEPLTKLADGEVTQRWPQLLPDAKAVLFTSSTVIANYQDASLVVQELQSGTRKVVQQGAYYGRYVPSGHLVYVRDGTLFAAAFDVNRLDLTGDPVPVLEGVASNVGVGTAQYAASDSAMAYLAGASINSRDAPIVWMDRAGGTKSLYSVVSNWSNPQFSPDGRRLAVDIVTGGQGDIGVVDLARDTLSRLTFGGGVNTKPVWTPDGQRIVFSSTRDGSANLDRQRADGAGSVQRLTESKGTQLAASWHPNGKLLAFTENNASGSSIMTMAIDGDESSGWKPGKLTMFLSTTRGLLGEPTFSPDGRWLAYHSNDTGRVEVFVQPYPGPGGKRQVSVDGGNYPTWSRTARQVLFQAPGNAAPIMAATYSVRGDSFESDKPQAWSARAYLFRPRNRSIDLHPDGTRVAIAPRGEDNAVKQDKVVLLLNFVDELRRLAPVKR